MSWRLPFASHEREEDYVADGFGAGEEHGEAVDADAFAAGGRQAVGEGADVVLVHLVGFRVAVLALRQLLFEALVLFDGVVELAEGVAEFEAAGEEFEALNVGRVVGLGFGERRDLGGVVVDDGGLDEVGLYNIFKKLVHNFAHRYGDFELGLRSREYPSRYS